MRVIRRGRLVTLRRGLAYRRFGGVRSPAFLRVAPLPLQITRKGTLITLIARAKSTILVVEDEAELLDLIARLLRRSGYEILEARTSPEAMSVFEGGRSPVDLILSDFNLPGGNGLQLAKRLRGTYAGVPVVFMSGNREAYDRIVEQGYVCLRKPFSFADMEQTLGQILSERRPLRADA